MTNGIRPITERDLDFQRSNFALIVCPTSLYSYFEAFRIPQFGYDLSWLEFPACIDVLDVGLVTILGEEKSRIARSHLRVIASALLGILCRLSLARTH